MLFKYKKYEYTKSKSKKESRLSILNNEFEEVFLKILNKETLSNEENQLFLSGFNEIKKYLVSSLLLNINKSYENKKPIEQKLSTLYSQYMYLYPEPDDFIYRIREDLDILCENSIYSAIGLGKKSFNKENSDSNLILFINNMFFYESLNFIEKNINNLKNEKVNLTNDLGDITKNEDFIIKEVEVEELLKSKNILDSVGSDMYEEIKEILLKEEDIPSHLEEIIIYIKS